MCMNYGTFIKRTCLLYWCIILKNIFESIRKFFFKAIFFNLHNLHLYIIQPNNPDSVCVVFVFCFCYRRMLFSYGTFFTYKLKLIIIFRGCLLGRVLRLEGKAQNSAMECPIKLNETIFSDLLHCRGFNLARNFSLIIGGFEPWPQKLHLDQHKTLFLLMLESELFSSIRR